MTKIALKGQAKKNSPRPTTSQKHAPLTFYDIKLRIRSFILGSAQPTIIRKLISKIEGNREKENKIIKEISPFIFWDVNISTLDIKHNRDLIIERVYTRGLEKDEMLLWKMYSWNEIRKTVINLLELDASTIRYLGVIFNIKEERFKCYGKKPSHLNC